MQIPEEFNTLIDQVEDLPTEIDKSDDIKNNVNNIISFCLKNENNYMRRYKIDEYKQICMKTFTNFHQKYPTLFFSIIENPTTFPLYRLNEMLALKKKIEEKEINEEKASVHLGQKYYNEFVKDTVSELDKNK
jgi:hypothetical protein